MGIGLAVADAGSFFARVWRYLPRGVYASRDLSLDRHAVNSRSFAATFDRRHLTILGRYARIVWSAVVGCAVFLQLGLFQAQSIVEKLSVCECQCSAAYSLISPSQFVLGREMRCKSHGTRR